MQQTFTEVSGQTHYHIAITLPETLASLLNTIYQYRVSTVISLASINNQIKGYKANQCYIIIQS